MCKTNQVFLPQKLKTITTTFLNNSINVLHAPFSDFIWLPKISVPFPLLPKKSQVFY